MKKIIRKFQEKTATYETGNIKITIHICESEYGGSHDYDVMKKIMEGKIKIDSVDTFIGAYEEIPRELDLDEWQPISSDYTPETFYSSDFDWSCFYIHTVAGWVHVELNYYLDYGYKALMIFLNSDY